MKLKRIYKAQAGLDTDLINFTKSFETFSPKVITVRGQKLIGWGSADPALIAKGSITKEEADAQIVKDYNSNEKVLKQRIKNWDNLSLGVRRALLETAYNIGVNKLINKSPKLMTILDSGETDPIKIAEHLDHGSAENGWLGIRSAARRAMARDVYDWNPAKVDAYGRALDPNKKVGKQDWKASPYYFKEKPKYSNWYNTVPQEYNNTQYYDLESAFNNLSYEEMEMWRRNPEVNHLPSGIELNNGDYQYLKHRWHPTMMYEQAWETMSPEGRRWRSEYSQDDFSAYPRLKRK